LRARARARASKTELQHSRINDRLIIDSFDLSLPYHRVYTSGEGKQISPLPGVSAMNDSRSVQAPQRLKRAVISLAQEGIDKKRTIAADKIRERQVRR